MNTEYIYAGTRAKAMEQNLLTENQLERLITAKSVKEAFSVLQDTFLAPYLSKHEETNITAALDKSILEAKKILSNIAPRPELLEILWIKYDFHNLKTIIKGKKADLSNEDILKKCFRAGVFTPEEMLKAFEEEHLDGLGHGFKQAAKKALESDKVFVIDVTMNEYYFKAITELTKISKDNFVKAFVTLQIDLFNTKAALRAQSIDELDSELIFVEGGTITLKELESTEKILITVLKIGGAKRWTKAIEEFQKTGNFNVLEKTADDYIVEFLKQKSSDTCSSAPLFAYFQAKKSNAQTIGAILVAKRSGMHEKELRTILRRLYA